MKKTRLLLVITVSILTAVVSLHFNPKSKNQVFRYVQNNHQQLTAEANRAIDEHLYLPYDYENFKVYYYPASEVQIVEFFVKGKGLASSSAYMGFYYSPDDIPSRWQGTGTVTQQEGNGWFYIEAGDNHGYTEKICDNWYWYEFYS